MEPAMFEDLLFHLVLDAGFFELIVGHDLGVDDHAFLILGFDQDLWGEEDEEFFAVFGDFGAAEEEAEEWDIAEDGDFLNAAVVGGGDESADDDGLAAADADGGGGAAFIDDGSVGA